jgi:phasin family protein
MAQTIEELKQAQSEVLKSLNTSAQKSLEGFQKLAAVHLENAKASVETAGEQIKALLAAKDVKAVTELVSSFTKPAADKFVAYAKAVYATSSETGTELVELVRAEVEKGNQQLVSNIQELAKNAPAGGEGAVRFVKDSLAAASTTYEQLQAATKRFVDAGVAGLTSAPAAAAEKTAKH